MSLNQKWVRISVSLTLTLIAVSIAQADPESLATTAQYYTLDETQTVNQTIAWAPPQDLLQEFKNKIEDFADTQITLLKWIAHDQALPAAAEPYARKKHFGTWMVDSRGNNCYNTRARALIRDASGQVSFNPSAQCTVEAGQWHDPYTGSTFDMAKDLQIDHVVPLKNAYMSGAAAWSPSKRCAYANFLAADYHLLSVSGHENMSKGDKSPAEYLPPNATFDCDYIQRWLKIKMIWGMVMGPNEAQGISNALIAHQCTYEKMRITRTELQQMRSATADEGPCATFNGESSNSFEN